MKKPVSKKPAAKKPPNVAPAEPLWAPSSIRPANSIVKALERAQQKAQKEVRRIGKGAEIVPPRKRRGK